MRGTVGGIFTYLGLCLLTWAHRDVHIFRRLSSLWDAVLFVIYVAPKSEWGYVQMSEEQNMLFELQSLSICPSATFAKREWRLWQLCISYHDCEKHQCCRLSHINTSPSGDFLFRIACVCHKKGSPHFELDQSGFVMLGNSSSRVFSLHGVSGLIEGSSSFHPSLSPHRWGINRVRPRINCNSLSQSTIMQCDCRPWLFCPFRFDIVRG